MDIGSGAGYPAAALSNFSPHGFTVRGEECASMEGFLQSLKFSDPQMARHVRTLVGKAAKFKGKKKRWWRTQELFWLGDTFDRHAEFYQELLDDAFEAMFTQNTKARAALLATNDATFTHSMGKRKASETVLTTSEFCGRLTRIRRQIRSAELTPEKVWGELTTYLNVAAQVTRRDDEDVHDETTNVIVALSTHVHTPAEVLSTIAELGVRFGITAALIGVAKNPNTPPDAMAWIVENTTEGEHLGLWRYVAQRGDLGEECVNILARTSARQGTVRALAQRQDLTECAALVLAKDDDRIVRLALCGATRLAHSVLTVLSADPAVEVRNAVARHSNTPDRVILTMVDDTSDTVLAAVFTELKTRGLITINGTHT